MHLRFIQATESDKDYLLELRKLTMRKYLEEAGQFLSEEEHGERVNFKFECSYLVFFEDELVGVVKYLSEENNVEIFQIQIDPTYQGKGYGTRVIQKILNSEEGKTVTLTVLKNNPAVELYKRLGFNMVGEDQFEYHLQYKC